jgi:hypothetical protein
MRATELLHDVSQSLWLDNTLRTGEDLVIARHTRTVVATQLAKEA